MWRLMIVALAALAVGPAGLWADTIYTSDGVFEGTCTDVDAKTVRITAGGKTFDLAKDKVLHVVRSTVAPDKPAPTKPPAGQTPDKPAAPTTKPSIFGEPDPSITPDKSSTKPPVKPAASPSKLIAELPVQPTFKPFTADSADHPDALVYLIMRGIAGTTSGGDLAGLRPQLDRDRGLSHDQKRKVGNEWLTPKDFVRHREKFVEGLDEAKRTEQDARRILTQPQYQVVTRRDPRTGRTTTERIPIRQPVKPKEEDDRLPVAAIAKLQLTAKSWADPAMRSYLMGLVEYKARNWATAEELIRHACSEQPRVAGFWQAYGMVLIETKGYERAMQAFLQAARLQPTNRDTPAMLQQALKQMPGQRIAEPIFAEAQRMLKEFEDMPQASGGAASGRNRSTIWLMPGRSWRANDNTLPVPPYDRFVFRQAIGVPVGQRTLLVDENVLKNAEEVFVKIGENTYVPAAARTSNSYGGKQLGLVPLSVEGATFTPIISQDSPAETRPAKRDTAPPKPDLVHGQSVTVLGLNCLEMMGSDVRQVAGIVESVAGDGSVKLNVALMPGEAAGPVLNRDGQLVGFLAGRTEVKEDLGGPEKFISLQDLRPFLEQARRTTTTQSSYNRVKRSAPPVEASGSYFTVLVTVSEILK